MTDAVLKTESLKRMTVAIDLLDANELNPNEMGDREFNLLVANMRDTGFTDPVLIRPHPTKPGRYRIVGGHHRVEAAKLLNFTEAPVTLITDPAFSEDDEKFQMVRHNIIRGKMSPKKFVTLYNSLNTQHSEEVAAEMFGFVKVDEMQKMIEQTLKGLPKGMKKEFKEAAKEIKTVKDLSKILNKLFAKHGSTLDFGYMIFDFEGKESIWIRLKAHQFESFQVLAERCFNDKKSLEAVVAALFRDLAAGKLDIQLTRWLKEAAEVVLPATVLMPTHDETEIG